MWQRLLFLWRLNALFGEEDRGESVSIPPYHLLPKHSNHLAMKSWQRGRAAAEVERLVTKLVFTLATLAARQGWFRGGDSWMEWDGMEARGAMGTVLVIFEGLGGCEVVRL